MSLAIFERLVAIIENGTYGTSGTTSLSAKALRTFPDSIAPIAGNVVLILPRPDAGEWQAESASQFTNRLSYDMHFYIQLISEQNQAKGIADAVNYADLATNIFLARPQLSLLPKATYPDIAEIENRCGWQITSNLSTPIPYPPANVSSGQGASFYWGFIARLTVPYRRYITLVI